MIAAPSHESAQQASTELSWILSQYIKIYKKRIAKADTTKTYENQLFLLMG
jgi:hypothetical protein